MPFLPFPEWKPDVSDFQGASSLIIENVLPRGDGYGPFQDFQALSQPLPAACRGYFFARNADGSIATFAGTATRLYKLNNTSFAWTDVSQGGVAYSALSSTFNWQFVQFNNFVIAVQQNVPPQVFDLTSSTAFANLGGSPPQASYVAVISRFVVLSGLLSFPYRVQWSGLNQVTTWDNVTAQSNYQDLADGGLTRGVAGGDQYGIVFQDSAVRSMTFNPGSPTVFDILKISSSDGMFAPYSAVNAGGQTYFCSTQGFKAIAPGGAPTPIGKEKFDRAFFADVDQANPQLIIGAADPKSPRIYWAYKSQSGQAGLFDKIIIYDFMLARATLVLMSGEYLATLAKPGLTLESLDAVAPGIITISNAANNGSGAIRLTLSGLSAGTPPENSDLTVANSVEVYGVTGTTEANGNWPFTIIDSTHIDLVGSSFTHAYAGGGAIGGALDQLSFSLDSISTGALAQLSGVSSAHAVGFYAGSNLAATLQTAEQGDGVRRMRVQALRPVTDAAAGLGAVVYRENLQSAPALGAASTIDARGLCVQNVSTRYARGQLIIPYGAAWTFATGIDPQFTLEGVQ
ncbi:MAG TPA: hypothetical protein VKW08_15095 [Xanthobacteraceae bacterium]|nr:hypothetical protein [Xanthobacteraceae bacterium]